MKIFLQRLMNCLPINIIATEIQINKKYNEKLYTRNCILKNLQIDLETEVNNYIRNIQTNFFD